MKNDRKNNNDAADNRRAAATGAADRADAGGTKREREPAQELAELFKIFGDATRLRILYALLRGETCVRDLASSLGMTPSAVSHQLMILRTSKLVRTRRDGKSIYYSLADDHVRTIIEMGTEHILE
ncbi:MAG: winged helix-turn-helix transcriptional regulator [Clostridia bacterium]|nr:winged helix-turn-helix transcriptional regulator [Clostridia bacterium]